MDENNKAYGSGQNQVKMYVNRHHYNIPNDCHVEVISESELQKRVSLEETANENNSRRIYVKNISSKAYIPFGKR